jgi:DNA-binding transcriptional ArsR family regulator
VFNAIAEPKRRAILLYVRDVERPVGDIARAVRIGQPSASKHLRVLRELNLVTERRDGRRVLYRTHSPSLKAVHDWTAVFEGLWTRQLEDVKRIAEAEASGGRPRGPDDNNDQPGES